jgi:ketosteroid isomerase-like protein
MNAKDRQMAEDVATIVAALEDERYAAMLSCDTAKLDRLLDDSLSYVHSSGRVDNKASYLNGFGRLWQHRSIDRQGQTIVPLGDTALVLNTLHIDVQVGEGPRKVSARALAVWNKSSGAWRLVAVFSAALPEGRS